MCIALQPASFSTTQQELGPKSLNLSVRRQENERIYRENKDFANRLNERIKQGVLPTKKGLDREYQRHLELKKMLTRVSKKRVPSYMGRQNHLPPLKTERAGGSAAEGSSSVNRSQENLGTGCLEAGEPGNLQHKVNSTIDLLSPSDHMLTRPTEGAPSKSPQRKGAKGRKEEVKRGGKTLKGKKNDG